MLPDAVLPRLGVPLGDSAHGWILLRTIGAKQCNLSIVVKQALVDIDAVFDGQPLTVDA